MSKLQKFFINVYQDGLYGLSYSSRKLAKWEAKEALKFDNVKVAYRLRIKLKHEES